MVHTCINGCIHKESPSGVKDGSGVSDDTAENCKYKFHWELLSLKVK